MHKITTKIFGHSPGFSDVGENGVGRGIHFITNGWTVSAQVGWGHYHSADPSRTGGVPLRGDTIRENCEVAIWDDDNNWIHFGPDTVKGWVNWHVVISLVCWLSSATDKPSASKVLEFFHYQERLPVEVSNKY